MTFSFIRHPNNIYPISSPIQISAIKCHNSCLETLIKYGDQGSLLKLNDHSESLLHLACRGIWSKMLQLREEMNLDLGREEQFLVGEGCDNVCKELESRQRAKEDMLLQHTTPVLETLLLAFKDYPDDFDAGLEDSIPTSPGTILHYFACLNYLEGVEELMDGPYHRYHSKLNKNGLTPLWIASWYNNITLGRILLQHGANPNDADPEKGLTPLHCAIYGYHVDRAVETSEFIGELIDRGADPMRVDHSGEMAAHLVIGTLDFRIMSKFIDQLGPECLEMKDASGNTLFHYAVSCLDEHIIYRLLERGANLMSRNSAEVEVEVDDFGHEVVVGSDEFDELEAEEARMLRRSRSVTIHRLPVQEAMKTGNSKNYFNAVRRIDYDEVSKNWTEEERFDFQTSHLLAAARELRPDIVRLLFQNIDDVAVLHRVLLYCDKANEDETFTKTALEWSVENNDRLCTTEILHQEYECHRTNKNAGLACLRRQLTGDELLMWTIETFTMFYDKTFAQKNVIPMLGLIPLFLSISTFIYDYYSGKRRI